jgi:chromosome partitioning protein
MGRIITFAQQKGGAGKTTVLAHLAAAWAAEGRRVVLIDLDPQKSLTRWAKLRADPTLDLLESRDYRAASDMKSAARTHDLVLVDCPGAASNLLEAAIRASDLVIAPLQPSVMDVWATETVLAAAARERTPVRILINRLPARTGALDEVLAALGPARAALLATRLGNRVAFANSVITGRTAPELARRSPAAAEIEALRTEIETLLPA